MAACLVLVLGASGAAATTPQRLSGWQFDELRDPMDTRKSVSVLEYHISGTPGFRVFALCSREPASAGLVTLTLGTGVGRHADGAEVTLHLTGPASDHQVTGYVTDAMMINDHNRSVLVQLRADDPIC